MRQLIHWKATPEYPFVLNLDELFTPYQNGVNINYKKFNFKGGEPHFQITHAIDSPDTSTLIITQRCNNASDIFDIVMANDAARRMGFKRISLILPYFPAARQDRVCNEGEPLTIKLFTDIINGCGFDEVVILSPHSEVTPALLNNVTVLDELKYVDKIIDSLDKSSHNVNIVCPDAGAGKRVNKVVQHLANNNGFVKFNLIRCEKVRDVKDGSITEFFVDGDLGGYPTLIVDDVLSLGGTFIGLGKKLKEKNCGRLMLFTSHADCVDGIQRMVEFFDHVYTTNSKRNYDDYTYTFSDKFTCFKIEL